MKIILLQNVSKLGEKFEIKDVNPGFARNFLLPRNLAKPATKAALLEIDRLKKEEMKQTKVDKQNFELLAKQIKNLTVKIQEKASKEGKLFGSVDKKRIKKELAENKISLGETVKIEMEKPFKKIGNYKVDLVFGNKKIPLKVSLKALKKGKSKQE